MNTPTHLSLSVAILGNRKRPLDTKWIIWGALLPDLPMYFLLVFDLLRKVPMQEIFDIRYFQDYWQIPLNFLNSIWLYLALIAIGYFLKMRGLIILSLAALLHILCDLPLHREDGHAHFWPLSDWKFISPVSYWDTRFHGDVFQAIEMVLLPISALWGARVFVHQWSRIIFLVVTLAMPLAYFGFQIYRLFAA